MYVQQYVVGAWGTATTTYATHLYNQSAISHVNVRAHVHAVLCSHPSFLSLPPSRTSTPLLHRYTMK